MHQAKTKTVWLDSDGESTDNADDDDDESASSTITLTETDSDSNDSLHLDSTKTKLKNKSKTNASASVESKKKATPVMKPRDDFTACPACGKLIPQSDVNMHLDTVCASLSTATKTSKAKKGKGSETMEKQTRKKKTTIEIDLASDDSESEEDRNRETEEDKKQISASFSSSSSSSCTTKAREKLVEKKEISSKVVQCPICSRLMPNEWALNIHIDAKECSKRPSGSKRSFSRVTGSDVEDIKDEESDGGLQPHSSSKRTKQASSAYTTDVPGLYLVPDIVSDTEV